MSEWKPIASAPRDGSPIEIKNDYGIMPTYSLCAWVRDEGWRQITNPNQGPIDGPHLYWREYEGDPVAYVDPTNGAQETPEYWRQAMR